MVINMADGSLYLKYLKMIYLQSLLWLHAWVITCYNYIIPISWGITSIPFYTTMVSYISTNRSLELHESKYYGDQVVLQSL